MKFETRQDLYWFSIALCAWYHGQCITIRTDDMDEKGKYSLAAIYQLRRSPYGITSERWFEDCIPWIRNPNSAG